MCKNSIVITKRYMCLHVMFWLTFQVIGRLQGLWMPRWRMASVRRHLPLL